LKNLSLVAIFGMLQLVHPLDPLGG